VLLPSQIICSVSGFRTHSGVMAMKVCGFCLGLAVIFVAASVIFCARAPKSALKSPIPPYPSNPFTINLDIPPLSREDSAGGIIVADLDMDGRMDYLVTVRGHVAAYRWDGQKFWVLKVDLRVGGAAEREGLPGHHGAGVQAADIDGDGRTEVLFLTNDSTLHVVDGTTGKTKWTAKPPIPEGAERWEHLAIVNLRGKGDRDIVLQATNAKGYRMGRYVAALLWTNFGKGAQNQFGNATISSLAPITA
jgi:hypothetical protein